jgi:hypothetical protein
MTDQAPEGYHFAGDDEMVAIKNYAAVHKALYDLAGLFITGPFMKEHKRPEVRAALAALAGHANWREAVAKMPRPG